MPRLVYTTRSKQSKSFALKRKLITIGRSSENDLVLDDPSVSSSHAHLLRDADGYTLSSMDGRTQLIVNGKTTRSHALKPDDRIQLGDATLFFRMDDAPREVPSKIQTTPAQLFAGLLSFSEQLMTELSSETLFRTLLDQLIELTGADKGFLVLVQGKTLKIPVARNVDQADLKKTIAQVSDSIIKRVIETGAPLVVTDAVHDTRFGSAQSVVDLKLSSVMCVPLKFKDQLLGVLYLGNNRVAGMFGPEDLELLQIYAGQAALVLYNAQLVNELLIDNQALREELKVSSFGEIVGQCDAMRSISRTIDKVADADISVLILGETGTGKELIARELHARSSRHDKPFVSINCGAIPENLLESELFGHVKGAFTGALNNRVGKFEAADGGTIFLDEIGEMPLSLQVKLLRVLQERLIDKVGETSPLAVDIRVVSASNKDMEQAIKDQSFREDLYYRLNELQIDVPPLRERGEDIVLLARYLLHKYAERYPKRKIKGFSKDALIALRRYYWPGNVRQMENKIKKAVIMSERNLITAEDLEVQTDARDQRIKSLQDAQAEFTLNYIKQVLEINNWNKTKTARELEVDPRTIFRYLEKVDN